MDGDRFHDVQPWLMSTAEVCKRLGISRDTWRKVLKTPGAPKPIVFGERDLRYRACDVQDYLARRVAGG